MKRVILIIALVLFPLTPAEGKDPVSQKIPERVVSLKPNITQTLIDFGLASRIIGMTKYCERPNAQATVVGDYKNFDSERVLRLKPDLVITSPENANSQEFFALENAGIKTLLLNFQNLEETLHSFRILDETFALKTPKEKFETELEDLRKLATPLTGKIFTVIVQRQPLMVAGGTSYISTLLSRIGFKNAFAQNKIAYPILDEEIFIRENADFVFDMTQSPETGQPFLNKNVFVLETKDFLASPRNVQALKNLINKLSENTGTPGVAQ